LSGLAGRAGPLAVAALCAAITVALGAALTQLGPWYAQLHKPPWQPPDFLFGPVWITIFTLWAVCAARAWSQIGARAARLRMAAWFGANLVLNTLWSALFFALHRPDWALIEVAGLWLSVLVLIGQLGRHLPPRSRHARWLLAPYLAWVSFASAVNLAIVRLNAPFA
jgi:tryptophan-rich sensory protein